MIKSTSVKYSSSWVTKPIRHIFHVLNGATPSSSEQSYWDGDIYWATPEDIGALKGKLLINTRRKITKAGYENSGTQLAPVKSIVLTTRAPVGNLALTGVPLCTNQGCKILVPRSKDIDPNYFYYQLLARKGDLDLLATGTTFQELGADKLRSFELLFPPTSEQQIIAHYLDKETARLDELIEAKEDLLALVIEKRSALISHTVTQGLDTNNPLSDSGVDWLGNIPMHWDTQFAKWLFREVDERSVNGDEELLTVSHLTGVTRRSEKDVNMFMAESLEGYKICQPGDLVINTLWAWMGAMGVAFEKGIVSPSYHVYRPLGQFEPYYLDYLMRIPTFAQEVARYSKGVWSSRLRLYPEEFFQVSLPVPSLREQQEIANYLVQETTKLDSLREAAQETIHLLRERRAALIAAAVSGKISVL